MAQQLQNITLASPGFGGINTQDSPLMQGLAFAAIADNAVIDKAGRIAARKGHSVISTNASAVLGTSDGIEHISEFVQQNGTKVLFTAGNLKIFTGTTTLTDTTPGSYTVTANDWSAATLNNKHYLFQRGHLPLVYDPAGPALTTIAAHASVSGTPPSANVCLAAYGRLWAADESNDKKTLYWSNLLDGLNWNTGSAGSLDLTNVWPVGTDEIVSLAAHNDFLIIFGKQSILIYQGADDPATMSLSDFVIGIGAVSRDSVVNIGTDVIYVDRSGVRSIGRTIQEKSSRIGDISRNVSNDIKAFIAADAANIKSIFDPNNAFILVLFPGLDAVYCFDTKFPLEDGSLRATTWSSIKPLCGYVNFDEELLIGVEDGLSKYSTNQDNGFKYLMSYFSNPLDFGDSSRLKFVKAIDLTTFDGSLARVVLQWAYDYTQNFTKTAFNLTEINTGQYNISEFNTTAEYGSSAVLTNTQRVNASGSGQVVQIGLETVVDGQPIAIQQLNVQSLVGRMV